MTKNPSQFCRYCGRELVIRNDRFSGGIVHVYATCPVRNILLNRIRYFWTLDNPHTDEFLERQYDETILNYDPITGARLK